MIQHWNFSNTSIPGLLAIDAFNASDVRGCLTKDYSRSIFHESGIDYEIAEVFYTTSRRGVIRALHFQREIQQPKLVRCIHGHVWDVAVDLRKNSPTFKKWMAFDLTGDNYKEILIPAGCAHGYLVIEDSIVSYKCSEKFCGEYDDGILWDDPDIGVQWPVALVGGREKIILADKDKNLQSFTQFMEIYGGF